MDFYSRKLYTLYIKLNTSTCSERYRETCIMLSLMVHSRYEARAQSRNRKGQAFHSRTLWSFYVDLSDNI